MHSFRLEPIQEININFNSKKFVHINRTVGVNDEFASINCYIDKCLSQLLNSGQIIISIYSNYKRTNPYTICALQKIKLITNIEKLTFWIKDNDKLHFAKQELILQINNLNISMNAEDFFIIDRQFLANVSFVRCKHNLS